jgi:hypothetical protein
MKIITLSSLPEKILEDDLDDRFEGCAKERNLNHIQIAILDSSLIEELCILTMDDI